MSKKLSMRVLPGVLLTRARRFDPVRRLSMLDLPALERPTNATSGVPPGGHSENRDAPARNCAEKVTIGL